MKSPQLLQPHITEEARETALTTPLGVSRQNQAQASLKDLMGRMVRAHERMDADPEFRKKVQKRLF